MVVAHRVQGRGEELDRLEDGNADQRVHADEDLVVHVEVAHPSQRSVAQSDLADIVEGGGETKGLHLVGAELQGSAELEGIVGDALGMAQRMGVFGLDGPGEGADRLPVAAAKVLVEPSVVDGEGSLFGEGLEEAPLSSRPLVAGAGVDSEHSEGVFTSPEREGEQ